MDFAGHDFPQSAGDEWLMNLTVCITTGV
jgi:hypothetical protein